MSNAVDAPALKAYIEHMQAKGAPQWAAELAAEQYATSEFYAGWKAAQAAVEERIERLRDTLGVVLGCDGLACSACERYITDALKAEAEGR